MNYFGLPRETWRRNGLGLVLVASALILFSGTAQLPLFDRDEPRFARATQEMMQRNEWIVPYFNGQYRFDKPILTYWLMRVGYLVCGQNELGARLHSIVFCLATATAIWAFGRRWFGAEIGALAAFFFATCLQVQIHGRFALADMPMVFFLVMTQGAFWELLQGERERIWFWLAYGSMGLGFLAKGPLAVLVPVVTVILYATLARRAVVVRNLKPWSGLGLVLAIVSIWGLPALIKTQGLFWKIGMMEHVVERGTVRLAGGGGFLPGYYFLTAILSLFPWVFFLPEAWQSYRQSASDRTVTPQTPDVRIFLGAWVLAVYGIFFFYRTQLPHYVLPAFPALFLLIATGLEQTVKPTGFIQGWRMVLGGLWVFILLAFGFLWLRGGGMSYSNDWKQIALFPILLLVGGGLMVRAWLRQTQRLVLMGFALLILGWSLAGTALRNVHPVIALEHSLIGYGSSFKLVGDGYSEPSLVFYTGAELLSGDLELTLKGDLITVRLLEEKDLGRWIKAAWSQREVQSKKVATPLIPSPGQKALFLEGVNIGRTSWVRLQVILPR